MSGISMRKYLGVLAAMVLCSCSNEWSAGLADQRSGSQTGSPTSSSTGQDGAAAVLRAPGDRSFANAPDKGALVQYPKDQMTRRTGAYTWHAADLSEDHALRSTITGTMRFTAPDGTPINLAYERHVEHPDGNWSWFGRADGERGESTVITFGEEAVFGSIPQGRDQPPLRLTIADGRAWVVSADPRQLKAVRNAATHPADQDFLVPPKLSVSTAASAATSTATGDMEAMGAEAVATTASGKTVVDVLVGFTDGYSAYRGGASAAITRIHNLIEVTNQAYRNSQVNAEVRLVHTLQVSYPDATANKAALEELSGFKAPSTRTPPAPAFSPLRAARDQYGADVVVLLRRFQDPENDGCGIAWLIGGGRSGIDASDEFFGYSVVGDGQDAGADGKTYFCRDETLAHEIGHNMGSQHDVDNAKKDDGSVSYGAYSYSFGYRTAAGAGDFYTVMAYGDSGQARNRVFSNPNISICGRYENIVCGVANQADNALSLNQAIPKIAAFRASVIPPSAVSARNDFNGDGKSDIYWRNISTGANDLWTMSGNTLTGVGTVYREPNQSWAIAGSGDFNGDGRADIFWRNTQTGQTFVHLMDGFRLLSSSGPSITVADQAWKVVAFGDFNGDSRTDIYWRNTSTGLNDIWLMGGTNPISIASVYREADQSWKVIGAGDFNGDGFDDILWRNSATGQNYIHLMYGTTVLSGSGSALTVASSSWRIASIGDFDGDGKADLYWRNSENGRNDLWTMNGLIATTINHVYTETDLAWTIVNSGDYNGDGKSDVLWRNVRTGANFMHLMNGARIVGASSLHPVSDLSWRVIGL